MPVSPRAHSADPLGRGNPPTPTKTVEPVGPDDSVILQATDNGVSWITLNRPDARNAITPDQRERLISEFFRASADPSVRAVVLTATGTAFCAGADLRATSPAPSDSPTSFTSSGPPAVAERAAGDVARTIRLGAQRLISAVLDCEKPVIAAVNGPAAGLGAHLALACDLVLAAETATFVEVFVRRGLVPDGGGAYLLPRLVGPQRAKELMFFGDALPAAEAERLGLVNRVVSEEELTGTARAWAERLATGPTRALALAKQLVNASFDSDRAAAFAAEAAAQEINMTTADAREGLASFRERRAPVYRGR
ncbi:enoyl-CoA hydratase/isomerase family protein [Streptomyces sp. ISL-11]|uniref:enoyl-CoA hydratase/isomerase family protein n=1 Tax=Streptomyces sp. ISL-11 TaxID=2819174 RepID=UPI001BEC474A|nr:enoyl-CoA hydratase-related protein [Streptomyces sp. ISL-11]MBT2387197.1 enoyl-CoA hydratase/isomerase family protein [Streptomyces sp. ISL-11]